MALRRKARSAALALFLGLGVSPAGATVVERVVAIVGEQAILLSELRERAAPFLLRVQAQAADGAQRAAATSQLYSQLLTRMVEEELQQKAANRANLAVTAREVDDALARVAAQNNVTVARVVEEATRSGLSEKQYREELRRQLLEAKLMNLRVQGRLRISDEDVRVAYQALVLDERRQLGFEAAWILLPAPRGASPAEQKAQRDEAALIVAQARAGADFGSLARRHSSHAATRDRGGALGALRAGDLGAPLDVAALSVDSGGVSDPIRRGDELVILKVLRRDPSKLPTFEESRDELGQRVYMEKMGRARQQWLDGLKRQSHVEIRL